MVRNKTIIPLLTACLLFCAIPGALGRNTNQKIEKPVKKSLQVRRDTQKKKEAWEAKKEDLTARLEALQEARSQLKAQRDEFLEYVRAAGARVAEKEKQLADIREIGLQIRPFLQNVISKLESGVSEGLPFLIAERMGRITRLKELMNDPEVSISEKYRKVMEALQVEAEYGTTIEASQQTIPLKDGDTLVDIFRLGRLNLFYLTLDRGGCGFYNPATVMWEPLPQTRLRGIQAAVDIASRRRTAELLTLPLGRITAK